MHLLRWGKGWSQRGLGPWTTWTPGRVVTSRCSTTLLHAAQPAAPLPSFPLRSRSGISRRSLNTAPSAEATAVQPLPAQAELPPPTSTASSTPRPGPPPNATGIPATTTSPPPLFPPGSLPTPPAASLHAKLPHPILRFKNLPDQANAEFSRETLLRHIARRHGRRAWHCFLYLSKHGLLGQLHYDDYILLLHLSTIDRITSRAQQNAQHLVGCMQRRGLVLRLEDYKALMYIQLRNRDVASVARTFETCRSAVAVSAASEAAGGPPAEGEPAQPAPMPAPVPPPDLKMWAILLYSLVELHDPALCWSLWPTVCREAPAAATDPELNAILLYGLGKAGRLEVALAHLAVLPAALQQDPLVRIGMIRAYGTAGRLVEAVSTFEAIPPDDRHFREYDAVLESTCYAGHVELSEHYFDSYCTACRTRRRLFDTRIITRMMQLYLDAGLPHMVERHLSLRQTEFPTYRQFELCIRALLQMGERRKAFKHFDKMQTIGFYPDTAFLDVA